MNVNNEINKINERRRDLLPGVAPVLRPRTRTRRAQLQLRGPPRPAVLRSPGRRHLLRLVQETLAAGRPDVLLPRVRLRRLLGVRGAAPADLLDSHLLRAGAGGCGPQGDVRFVAVVRAVRAAGTDRRRRRRRRRRRMNRGRGRRDDAPWGRRGVRCKD